MCPRPWIRLARVGPSDGLWSLAVGAICYCRIGSLLQARSLHVSFSISEVLLEIPSLAQLSLGRKERDG